MRYYKFKSTQQQMVSPNVYTLTRRKKKWLATAIHDSLMTFCRFDDFLISFTLVFSWNWRNKNWTRDKRNELHEWIRIFYDRRHCRCHHRCRQQSKRAMLLICLLYTYKFSLSKRATTTTTKKKQRRKIIIVEHRK